MCCRHCARVKGSRAREPYGNSPLLAARGAFGHRERVIDVGQNRASAAEQGSAGVGKPGIAGGYGHSDDGRNAKKRPAAIHSGVSFGCHRRPRKQRHESVVLPDHRRCRCPISASACSSQNRMPILAAHHRRGGEVVLRVRSLAPASRELAQAEVPARDQWAHTELLGQCERVTEVVFSVLGGVAAAGGLAEEVERPSLVVAVAAL